MYVTFTTTEEPMAVPEAVAYALEHPTERLENAKWDAELPNLSPAGPCWAYYDDDPDLPPTIDEWMIRECKGLIRIGLIDKPHMYRVTELYAVSDGKTVSYLRHVLPETERLVWGNGWTSKRTVPEGWYPILSGSFVPKEADR